MAVWQQWSKRWHENTSHRNGHWMMLYITQRWQTLNERSKSSHLQTKVSMCMVWVWMVLPGADKRVILSSLSPSNSLVRFPYCTSVLKAERWKISQRRANNSMNAQSISTLHEPTDTLLPWLIYPVMRRRIVITGYYAVVLYFWTTKEVITIQVLQVNINKHLRHNTHKLSIYNYFYNPTDY